MYCRQIGSYEAVSPDLRHNFRFPGNSGISEMGEDILGKRSAMLYRWNQIDPQSAVILKTLVAMLCTSLARFYFGRSHPIMALTAGLSIGVLLGQAIPPRLSLRRLA